VMSISTKSRIGPYVCKFQEKKDKKRRSESSASKACIGGKQNNTAAAFSPKRNCPE